MVRKVAVVVLAGMLAACARKSEPLTDGELKRHVERLFAAADPERRNQRVLGGAGDRAAPLLVQALDDPRTWAVQFDRNATGTSPLERICDLLRQTAPSQAAKPLARYMDHPQGWFRCQAAGVLARIGTEECLAPVKKALSDPDQRVRQYALDGVVLGARARRQCEPFLAGVFDAVVPMLRDGHRYDWQAPATVLVTIDMERAAAILEGPEFFTTRYAQLEDVLKALGFSKHKTPQAILMPMLKELAPAAASDVRRAYEFAAALRLYAHNPDGDAEATFRALVASPVDTVATGAGWALEDLMGVNTGRVMDLGHHDQFATMTTAQRYYYAVSEYHFEVCNGGHDQFFRNSSGDIYPTVVEGLRAMGARSKADILEGALHAFTIRPSTDRRLRQDQVAALSQAGDALLNRADEMYYASEKKAGERIEVLMSLFAVANRADF